MDTNIKIAYTEVNEILNMMDEEFQNKIPEKLRILISENKLNDYHVKINPNISLKKQISKKALAIMAVINYNYWCVGEEEKKKLLEIYKHNEENRQEKLSIQYNIDDVFKNKTKILNDNKDKQLVLYNKKENFLIKIINKIKKMLKIDTMSKK